MGLEKDIGDLLTETETAVAAGAGRLMRAEVKLGGFILLSGLPRTLPVTGLGLGLGLGLSTSASVSWAALWYSASYCSISSLLIRYLASSPSMLPWLSGMEFDLLNWSFTFPTEVRLGMLAALDIEGAGGRRAGQRTVS